VQAEADAWHLSLAGFLVEQLEDEEGVFRLKPDIAKDVLRAASASYEVPNDETLVGMFADFTDQPELFGILFGRRGIYFNNDPVGSSSDAHAVPYSSFPAREFSPDIEWLRLGDDLVLVTMGAGETLAPVFRRLGDLFEHSRAALEERDELLTAEEVEEFAQRVYDGWKVNQEAQAQADGAWTDELVAFLRNHPGGSVFVAPNIPERKTSHG
jgi:hypothetical protein